MCRVTHLSFSTKKSLDRLKVVVSRSEAVKASPCMSCCSWDGWVLIVQISFRVFNSCMICQSKKKSGFLLDEFPHAMAYRIFRSAKCICVRDPQIHADVLISLWTKKLCHDFGGCWFAKPTPWYKRVGIVDQPSTVNFLHQKVFVRTCWWKSWRKKRGGCVAKPKKQKQNLMGNPRVMKWLWYDSDSKMMSTKIGFVFLHHIFTLYG